MTNNSKCSGSVNRGPLGRTMRVLIMDFIFGRTVGVLLVDFIFGRTMGVLILDPIYDDGSEGFFLHDIDDGSVNRVDCG